MDKTEIAANSSKPGQAETSSSDKQTFPSPQPLDLALEHHSAGRLSQAENIYQQILLADPNQPVALHLLGVIAHQVGKNDVAVDRISKALIIKPDYAEAHNNLGNVFKELGRLGEAVVCYQKAIGIKTDFAEAYSNLGNVLKDLGQLDEAVANCLKALAINPDNAEANNNLGNALQGLEKLDVAVAHYNKALAIKPNYAEAYFNLGNAQQQQGKLDEAVINYSKAINIQPDNAEAHNNLGNSLQGLRMLNEAITSYHKALTIKPDYAEAHSNLGNALQGLGKLDEAVASHHKAVTIKPDYAEAFNNLGIVLKELGKSEEAASSYQQALAINPNYAEAHYNLGNTYRDIGKLNEAVAGYNKALTIKSGFAQAYSNLGSVLKELGRLSEARTAFDQGFRINHGGPWWNAQTFADGDSAGTSPKAETMFTSNFQLHDTIDQLEYLIAKGRIDSSFQHLADRYRAVLAELPLDEGPDAVAKLTANQLERLGSSYNRVIYYGEASRIGTDTVNRSLDFEKIEECYLSSPVSVTTLDDFLIPKALHVLRDFCLESTIFFAYSGNRFLESKLRSGFNCELLYQISEELREHFPNVLDGCYLANIWIYRYNNQSVGVSPHTDEGTVTFNFWITPDDANLVPDRGGLIVYTKEQPSDWDWRYYNRNKYDPAVSREIADFLSDADTVKIPYRENRAVLFQSNLFHKSDQIYFRDGFENRRMNITLIYDKRDCQIS